MSNKTFKWLTVGVIILLDLSLLPTFILAFLEILKQQPENVSLILKSFNPWSTFKLLFQEREILHFFLVFQGLVLMLCICVFWPTFLTRKKYKLDDIGGPPAAGSGQFGTSRWQTEKEIDQNSTVWYFKEQKLERGGTVLGMDPEKNKAWLDTEDTHKLIIGTTRSGKTRTVVYPTIYAIAQAGESMILTDPKGELFDRTSDYLKDQGYDVVVIDFIDPGRGNKWNPIDMVVRSLKEGDETEAAKAAWNVAHLLAHQKDSKGDSIWVDGSESVIAALIFAIAKEAKDDNQKHMTSVYKTLGELGDVVKVPLPNGMIEEIVPLNEYFKALPKDHPARDAYITARLSPEKMRGSFFGSVSVMLRLWADPGVAYLTSKQDHNLDDVGKKKTAVFLIIPDEDTTRYPLAALYVDQTYQALVRLSRKTRNRLPLRVHMLLDEFGNMPQFKDFVSKLTVSGGRGILWNIVVQGISQIKKTYGADSLETILGNCHTWIYILTTDSSTAKELSFKTGKYTVENETISHNVSAKSTGSGASRGLTGRELLMADEILKWPKEMSLLIRARQNPSKLPCPDITKWPADELFTWREDNDERTIRKVPIFIPGISEDVPSPDSNQKYTADADNALDFID